MNDLSGAMKDALVQMRGSAAQAKAGDSMPRNSMLVLTGQEAAQLVATTPSAGLVAALEQARKIEDGPITYTAANGEIVRMERGALIASPTLVDEARRRLRAIEIIVGTPSHPAVLAKWLYRLSRTVERAPTEDELDRAVRDLGEDLRELPASVFTEDTRRQVAVELVYWPSYAKLARALDKLVDPMRVEKRRLEAITAAGGTRALTPPAKASSARLPRTEEERTAVRAKVKALQDVAPPRPKKRWTPLPVAPVRSVEEQIAALKTWPAPTCQAAPASPPDVQ
jgi:hypothetical protein